MLCLASKLLTRFVKLGHIQMLEFADLENWDVRLGRWGDIWGALQSNILSNAQVEFSNVGFTPINGHLDTLRLCLMVPNVCRNAVIGIQPCPSSKFSGRLISLAIFR